MSRLATAKDITFAFRRAAKRTHPDNGGSDEAFREVRAAYEAIRTEDARRRYDATLFERDHRGESFGTDSTVRAAAEDNRTPPPRTSTTSASAGTPPTPSGEFRHGASVEFVALLSAALFVWTTTLSAQLFHHSLGVGLAIGGATAILEWWLWGWGRERRLGWLTAKRWAAISFFGWMYGGRPLLLVPIVGIVAILVVRTATTVRRRSRGLSQRMER